MKVEDSHGGLAGRSILEMIWEELDTAYADLKAMPGKTLDATLNKQRGVCLGLATAIAIITNPYDPNVDAIREEAAERDKARRVSETKTPRRSRT